MTPDQVKDRKTVFIADDRFAVDQARPHAQRFDGHRDEGKAACEVIPVTGNQPNSRTIPPRQNAEAVMLYFVNPA
jgi:hypothetical protein